jgi:hypothetical protein
MQNAKFKMQTKALAGVLVCILHFELRVHTLMALRRPEPLQSEAAMRARLLAVTLAAVVALLATSGALGAFQLRSTAEPPPQLIGSWRLNVAKSKYSPARRFDPKHASTQSRLMA